jgi:CheY-like chemotaxis protein
MDVQMPEKAVAAILASVPVTQIPVTRESPNVYMFDLDGPQSQIPIIALTANAMKGDEEKYRASGMNDYVTKPIESDKLAASMQRQCGPGVNLRPEEPRVPTVRSLIPRQASTDRDTALQQELDKLFRDIDAGNA